MDTYPKQVVITTGTPAHPVPVLARITSPAPTPCSH